MTPLAVWGVPCPRYHHVVRVGGKVAVSYTARDQVASDRSIAKLRQGSAVPIVGRWIVRDHAPLIADLCGPMGRPHP